MSFVALYQRVLRYFMKPVAERTESDVDIIYPWFVQHSTLFASLRQEVAKDIIRNCEMEKYTGDTVIIRQFEKGDCFFIILSGKVSIYVQTDEPQLSEEPTDAAKAKPGKAEDRSKLGQFVGHLEPGGCFGEVALLDKESLRTATVIADCETELIVIDRTLYNRSLREVHQVELREKAEFVNRCPAFAGWPYALLKQVGLSLRKVTMSYGAPVVRQGEPLNKMFFLLSGQVQVSVDILMHQKQFPEMMPKPKPLSTDALLSIDKSALDIEYQLNPLELLSQKERAKQKLVQKPISRLGYRFGERLRGLRHIDLAIYSGGEVFGELEYGFGMKTYCFTATCIEPSEFFVLHKNNITRLMNSRRNINSWKKLTALAQKNLATHFEQIQLHRVPLFQNLYDKYMENKRQAEEEQRERAARAKKDVKSVSSYEEFIPSRGAVIDQYGPGTVFYRNQQRRAAAERAEKIKMPLPFGSQLY
ncbi:cAMP-dependent protein kinase regulatory subunit [Clonorchis sinensis]|uniref:cAMP-dependent protein kinase regulatory subunit n=1 Tax=Clonorchis sinensis TaxID=79923 RepID=A0A8T1MUK9_CLOSI|nr:cAMP-dependent protein kinase regulatory subunit [Clonorchis sinensis]